MKSNYILQTIFQLSIAFILVSCNNTNKSNSKLSSNVQNIDINIKQVSNSVSSVFDKIELIQLETNDTSIIGKIDFVKCLDNKYFGIMDKTLIVHIFETNGSFVSNSMKCYGIGPNEYYTITDFTYNRFSHQFELLDYSNKIFCYDKHFNFIKTIKIKDNNIKKFNRFLSIAESSYVLTPSFVEPTDKICLFNSEKSEVDVLKFDGNLSNVSMQETPFTFLDEEIVFSPSNTNYSIFKLNINKKSIEQLYYLNIMSDKINEKILSGIESDIEKRKYLMSNSNSVLPIRNLVSSNYVISNLIKNNELFTNIYNLDSKSSVILKNKRQGFSLPQFFSIQNKILYACIYPFEIEKYIDKALLDDASLDIIAKSNSELNPIIVKYHLK